MIPLRRWTAILLCLLMLPAAALGETWYTFTVDNPPEALLLPASPVDGDVVITFLGDCALGGVRKMQGAERGFVKTVERMGYAYPLQNLLPLTAEDDITVANLEGVLSDRKLKRVPKEYNFQGKTEYTEILRLGSVELVTLANNHTHDYGDDGYNDTKQALKAAEIPYFTEKSVTVWERDGLRIGFVGVQYSASGDKGKRMKQQIALLKELGCAAVITVMHAGEEHTQDLSDYQHQIVSRAIAGGADMIVGHHPHVVQGFDMIDGVPVAYSLGNCSFGGTLIPADADALVLQTKLHIEGGRLVSGELAFHPISITGDEKYNDYSPVLAAGEDAARVLQKMEASTGYAMPPFEEGRGSVVHVDW
ncbi:MAG: CapA family protein [Clostridia bacterium]|nr:CapA family protein [Clostridia bacterium]